MSPKASNTKQIGNKGEQVAADYIAKRGYTILHRNFYHNKAEIDIIAKDDDFIVFVEVKTRYKKDYHGSNSEFLTLSQQKRIVQAGHHYIVENDIDLEARFDLAVVLFSSSNHFEIEHIEDAFSAGL